MTSFVHELKRRNVLRVAAAYALVAWIFIEAGSVLLPTFGAPDWFFATVYVPVAIGGFIVAMIIAWVFEITPDGVKLERDVDRTTYSPRRSRGGNRWIIVLLVIALGISITFNITGMRGEAVSTGDQVAHDSIAVLPFENRSTDEENRYFADGIHDDILNRLAEIESLRVISRTSVIEYRGTTKNAREIAEELGVTTILDGAVQRVGDQVRITVQLIDAINDQTLWSDTFDREYTLENIFALQTAISSQIATSLQAAMTSDQESRLASVPTTSTEAYVAYVKGTQNLAERKFETLIEARRHFEEAIALDPTYAEAHAKLATTILVGTANHTLMVPGEAYPLAEFHLKRALELDPELAIAHAAQGLLEMSRWEIDRIGDGDRRAAAAYEEALRINSNLADAYIWYASLRSDKGDNAGAVDLLTKALTIDPLSRIPYVNLPSFLSAQGENAEATRLLLEAMELFPDWETPYQYMSNHMLRLGRLDEAMAWGLKARSFTTDPMSGASIMPIYQDFGDEEAILTFVESFPQEHPLYPMGKGYWHYIMRDYEAAISELGAIPEDTGFPAQFYKPLLAAASVMTGNMDAAYGYLLSGNPALMPDSEITVDKFNLNIAILLAWVQQQRNQPDDARRLLEKAEPLVRSMPRLGMSGHGIKDVHILTLRGRHDAALDALSDAVEDGYVSSQAFDGWPLIDDPILNALRRDPRFEAIQQRIDNRIEIMRRNAEIAEESGNWQPLLAKAGST